MSFIVNLMEFVNKCVYCLVVDLTLVRSSKMQVTDRCASAQATRWLVEGEPVSSFLADGKSCKVTEQQPRCPQAKAFVQSHRPSAGMLVPSTTAQYSCPMQAVRNRF